MNKLYNEATLSSDLITRLQKHANVQGVGSVLRQQLMIGSGGWPSGHIIANPVRNLHVPADIQEGVIVRK